MDNNDFSKITGLTYYTKGKRGLIYTGTYKQKKVAIKKKNPKTTALDPLSHEIRILKELNKYGIGPKLLFYNSDGLACEFIDGSHILDFIDNAKKDEIKAILLNVMEQMILLDKLGYNKEEMHHPYKHIIISTTGKPVLLDFERCRKTIRPKNVTQFSQALTAGKMGALLRKKGFVFDVRKMSVLLPEIKTNSSAATKEKIINIIRQA